VSSAPKLPSEVEFASFLVYNPSKTRFPEEIAHNSRVVARAVKNETAQWAKAQRLAERLRDEIDDDIREKFLPRNATLVPMPGHAPMKKPLASHWPGRELCEQFVEAGLGAQWLPLLERLKAVPKSAFASKEEREDLTAEVHYDSFSVSVDLAAGTTLVLVDDVVTRGTTMLAGIARLQAAYPQAAVRGFALIRTMSSELITAVKAPCEGKIRQVPWGTQREP